jgi:hypothetical protein
MHICTFDNRDQTFHLRARLGVRGAYHYHPLTQPNFQRISADG